MSAAPYIGSTWKVRVAVTTRNESTGIVGAADPSTFVCKVIKPDGSVTTLTYGTDADFHRNSTGSYWVQIHFTQAGRWRFEFTGTGAAAGYERKDIQVAA